MNGRDTLGATLEAFIREHEYCGELDDERRSRAADRLMPHRAM
jgi:hypothetical protein